MIISIARSWIVEFRVCVINNCLCCLIMLFESVIFWWGMKCYSIPLLKSYDKWVMIKVEGLDWRAPPRGPPLWIIIQSGRVSDQIHCANVRLPHPHRFAGGCCATSSPHHPVRDSVDIRSGIHRRDRLISSWRCDWWSRSWRPHFPANSSPVPNRI